MFSLDGKVAWVTGGSYGIGFAIATALSEAGANVVFNGIHEENIKRGIEEYKKNGLNVKGYICDVTKEEEVNAFVDMLIKEFGRIDILVNNAGIIKRIPAVDMTVDEYKEVVDVDLVAPFIVSKAVAPHMIRNGGGKIINICSLMSELGRETVCAYAAAKGGLKMLTRSLASEWGQYNIQVNGIAPGYIATPQTAPLRQDGNPFNEYIKARTPANRWGTPEDLKGPCVFLASKASDFVNGHVLFVDGGILAYIGKQP
ncbi:MAG TPA: gluconate 5-dehydrogenase [Clostridiaceae bacterium]|jgi:gluconate 5-dehydrogenase|nr:gluconate 5-dehydrogenase [Clostridiaceae bacterium]